METTLRYLAVFILLDVIAAVLLVVLVCLVHRRQTENESPPYKSLGGVLLFLAGIAALVYGGIWMCLRSAV